MSTVKKMRVSARGAIKLRKKRNGFEVDDQLLGETYFVEVDRGRWVGACSCGSPPSLPFLSCRHQSSVRNYLFDRWFRNRRKVGQPM